MSDTIHITIKETSGINRFSEPVTVGVPFPKGLLRGESSLGLHDTKNGDLPLQTQMLARWPDGSLKWVLLDFQVSIEANGLKELELTQILPTKTNEDCTKNQAEIIIKNDTNSINICTGAASFFINTSVFKPFDRVVIDKADILENSKSKIILTGESGTEYEPHINNIFIETEGRLRTTLKVEGNFKSLRKTAFANFISRISFFSNSSIVKIDFTIRNSKAAKHSDGYWDLGDEGSIYFDDLSSHFALSQKQDISIYWKAQKNEEMKELNQKNLEIYQDSSGGENWNSNNHVNRYGKVMNSFRGYKVRSDRLLDKGDRAEPTIAVSSGNLATMATIKNFWQNFPKSIEAEKNKLILRLFPKQYNDLFELQGGEQKTHTFYISFVNSAGDLTGIDWVNSPLIPQLTPEWYTKSMAIGYMMPMEKDKNSDYQKLVNNVISGKNSAFVNRENIDEYGWRNFGDLQANHEYANYKGTQFPLISHYNNQYDVICGFILQYARSGEQKWYELANDLAKHAMDIDIYHTKSDRRVYNCGYFWHTDHFMHAQTSTHRSFSRKNREYNPKISTSYCAGSGGLSPENCYTTGLCKYYFLTGNAMAKDAVIELANWIIDFDRMDKNILGILRKIKSTISSMLDEYSDVPGRLQGNSIQTVLDGFEITYDMKYLRKAEDILKKYISPSDDIDRLNKQKIELRWSYLVFLQSIGRYLDVKDSMNKRDKMFNYARESLLHHARWMLKNEVPYKQLFDIVEIKSSTWPAHDIRKSVVFDYAYKYADGPLKEAFKEKSEYFYNISISDVLSFKDDSRTFIRPLAILMNYGVQHTHFQ